MSITTHLHYTNCCFQGLKFPWESAVTGRDVCPDDLIVQQEIHINGDVVLAFKQYFYLTQVQTLQAQTLTPAQESIQTIRVCSSRRTWRCSRWDGEARWYGVLPTTGFQGWPGTPPTRSTISKVNFFDYYSFYFQILLYKQCEVLFLYCSSIRGDTAGWVLHQCWQLGVYKCCRPMQVCVCVHL